MKMIFEGIADREIEESFGKYQIAGILISNVSIAKITLNNLTVYNT